MRRILLALLLLTLQGGWILYHPGGGATAGAAPITVELTRTFTQAAGATNNFWLTGAPFVSYPATTNGSGATADVPSGYAIPVTGGGTLGGTGVRVGGCPNDYDAAGDVSWAAMMVDFSAASIAGSSGTLQLTSSPGSWSTTTAATDADWKALHDVVTIANITAYGGSGADMDSGTYTATFDGTGSSTETIIPQCSTPLGRMVRVVSTMVNTTPTTHCFLTAEMFYWVTENSSGAHGISNSPIASYGPIIENDQIFKNGSNGCTVSTDKPGTFIADITWTRNSTQMRQFLGVPIPAATDAPMLRGDAQWDWDDATDFGNNVINVHSDPGVVVTQAYANVDATYKTPPYIHGISYTGGGSYGNGVWASAGSVTISAVNTSTGEFTATPSNVQGTIWSNSSGNLVGGGNVPSAIMFTGSVGSLTGLNANSGNTSNTSTTQTVYWICPAAQTQAGGNQFYIFKTEMDAWGSLGASSCNLGAGNGQVIPGGSYGGSGLSAIIAEAPESVATNYTHQGDGGDRPELSLFGEAASAYLLGNNSTWQITARVMGVAQSTFPIFGLNDATGTVPSFLDQTTQNSCCAGTNMAGGSGLGTSKATTSFMIPGSPYSSDINSSLGPVGNSGAGACANDPRSTCGMMNFSTSHQTANPCWVIWLLEANPYCQELIVKYGEEGEWQGDKIASRNFSQAVVGSGKTYYGLPGMLGSTTASERGISWSNRDLGMAAFAASYGSAEKAYFEQLLGNQSEFWNDYATFKGGNWAVQPFDYPDDFNIYASTLTDTSGPYTSIFEHSYGNAATGYISQLMGDVLDSNYKKWSDLFPNMTANLYASGVCSWFSDQYPGPDVTTTPQNQTPPGAYVGSAGEYGVSFGQTTLYTFAGSTVTSLEGSGYVGALATLPFAAGDKFRAFDGTLPSFEATTPPTNLTMGQDYSILNPSGATFQLNNGSGSPITFSGGNTAQAAISATWTATGGGTLTINTASATGMYAGSNNPVVLSGFTTSPASSPNGEYLSSTYISSTSFSVPLSGSGTVTVLGTVSPASLGYMIPGATTVGNCPSTSDGGFLIGNNSGYIDKNAGSLGLAASRLGASAGATFATASTAARSRTPTFPWGSGESGWAWTTSP